MCSVAFLGFSVNLINMRCWYSLVTSAPSYLSILGPIPPSNEAIVVDYCYLILVYCKFNAIDQSYAIDLHDYINFYFLYCWHLTSKFAVFLGLVTFVFLFILYFKYFTWSFMTTGCILIYFIGYLCFEMYLLLCWIIRHEMRLEEVF